MYVYICIYVCICIYMYVCMCVCVYLSLCLSFYLSLCLSLYLSLACFFLCFFVRPVEAFAPRAFCKGVNTFSVLRQYILYYYLKRKLELYFKCLKKFPKLNGGGVFREKFYFNVRKKICRDNTRTKCFLFFK